MKLLTEPNSPHRGSVIWFNAGADELFHDAAVAHALMRGIDHVKDTDALMLTVADVLTVIHNHAERVLRTEFCIEENE